MDQIPLVNEQIEDGKKLLERLTEKGITVSAACWLKESESSRWYLYIASSLVGPGGGTLEGYRRLLALFQEIPQPFWVDPFEVKLVESKHPLSKAVQELIRSSKGRLPMRLGSGGLGGISIDAACIYPPVSAPVRQG
jgi:hypothetical protein